MTNRRARAHVSLNDLVWDLPRWVHDLILLVSGYRLVRCTNDRPNEQAWYYYEWTRRYPR